MTADALSAEERGEWIRAGNLLYTLEQVGWRRSGPVERNKYMVRVEGGPGALPDDVAAIADRLQDFLNGTAKLATPELIALGEAAVRYAARPHDGHYHEMTDFARAYAASVASIPTGDTSHGG
jgi:hypothetical protein